MITAVEQTRGGNRPRRYQAKNMSKTDDTLVPPTDREAETNPKASEAPLAKLEPILPPATPVPTNEELASTQLASREVPAWWVDSFIGQQLESFARKAEEVLRAERGHSEKLDEIGRKQDDNHRRLSSGLARIGERVTRIESDQRAMGREIKDIRETAGEERIDRQRDMREMKSIATALTIRMDMYESNGHTPRDLENVVVLVVEDEVLLQRTITRALQKQGALVQVASSWQEVNDSAGSQTPSFAVIDIRLEGGEDGAHIAEHLMRKHGMKPRQIVLMSGQIERNVDEVASELGLRLIEKPFGVAAIVDAIKESLAAAEPTETPPGK